MEDINANVTDEAVCEADCEIMLMAAPEFEDLIPKMTVETVRLLEENLANNGCVYPVIVWKGRIIDGHERYRICKTKGIPFDVKEMDFEDTDEAKLWVARNILGRPHLSRFEKCEVALKAKPYVEKEAEKRRRNGWKRRSSGNLMPNLVGDEAEEAWGTTRDIISEMAGVSHGTLDKAEFIIKSPCNDLKEKLRNGEITISAAYKIVKDNEEANKKPEKKKSKNKPSNRISDAISTVEEKVKTGEIPISLMEHYASGDVEDADCYEDAAYEVSDFLSVLNSELSEDLMEAVEKYVQYMGEAIECVYEDSGLTRQIEDLILSVSDSLLKRLPEWGKSEK